MDASKKREPIPEQFESVEEAADFWDTHSLADYWDQVHEVEIEVRAHRRRRVTLDPDIWDQIVNQARIRGVSSETLKSPSRKLPRRARGRLGAFWPRF
jgi:hypothetical protein